MAMSTRLRASIALLLSTVAGVAPSGARYATAFVKNRLDRTHREYAVDLTGGCGWT